GLPNAMAADLLFHRKDRVLIRGTRNRGAWADRRAIEREGEPLADRAAGQPVERGAAVDFIERLFGISPDGGDGSTELMYLIVLAVIVVAVACRRTLSAFLSRRR